MLTEAPYDQHGNLLHYPDVAYHLRYLHPDDPTDWRPNTPFTATITLTGMTRGRSAAYFTVTDENGKEYPLFMADLRDLMAATVIDHGTVSAQWVVGKRGQNYGLRLAAEAACSDRSD